jgi:glutamyl-Q tRNA(Asp) synthetase
VITQPIFRFAPSPNGYLHLGHAYSALLNHDMAQAAGARLLLRIEDIDAQRCRPEYEKAIYEDLRWLGIAWQEPVRRQSENFPDYQAAIARLEADGLIYSSFESRSEINSLVAEYERRGAGRAIPTARPSILAPCGRCRPPNVNGAVAPASRLRCASLWAPHLRAPARSAGQRPAAGRKAKAAASPPRRRCGAM